MKNSNHVDVKGISIRIKTINKEKYISLTDIAMKKNPEEPRFVVINWLRNRNTIDFLGLWETLHNPTFNRVGFDTVKAQTGYNSFVISPARWIAETSSIGLLSKGGRHKGGTYAHEDIAMEFASWISSEFKLYLIKEFKRLKSAEQEKIIEKWDVKRELTKINYRIHTAAIRENLIPPEISTKDSKLIYASEADVLNKALFGITAKEWSDNNPKKKGNIRDYANITQLIVLANLETLNSEFIKQKMTQDIRLIQLNKIAISQMTILLENNSIRKLQKK